MEQARRYGRIVTRPGTPKGLYTIKMGSYFANTYMFELHASDVQHNNTVKLALGVA